LILPKENIMEATSKNTLAQLPVSCSFQAKGRDMDNAEVTLCTLAAGVCPIQLSQTGPGWEKIIVCREPHCCWTDWQVVEQEKQ
jgi:hypothetical protein